MEHAKAKYKESKLQAEAIASVGEELLEKIESNASRMKEYYQKAEEKEANGEDGSYYRNWAEALAMENELYKDIEQWFRGCFLKDLRRINEV